MLSSLLRPQLRRLPAAHPTSLLLVGGDLQDTPTRSPMDNAGTSYPREVASLVTACEDGVVRVFTDIKSHDGAQSSGTAREGKLSGASGRLHAVDVSDDAKLIVTGGQNGAVYLWRDRKLSATLK